MTKRYVPWVLGGAWVCAAGALARDVPSVPMQVPTQTDDPANCVNVSATVTHSTWGNVHVVNVRNGCDRPVVCEVWTDVDPLPHLIVRADPGQTAGVITEQGATETRVVPGSMCRFE